MKLLTKEIESQLEGSPIGSHDGEPFPKVIVKFFTPWSNWTWYATEGSKQENGDWEFFGLVEGIETELGLFYLSELEGIRGPAGLKVERDRFFSGRVLDMGQFPPKVIAAPEKAA